MRNFISEIRRLKLRHGNHINSIEKKKNRLAVLRAQVDLMYGNPVLFAGRIDKVERAMEAIQNGGAW